MLARIDTWTFETIQRDRWGRLCLHYRRNMTRYRRPIRYVGRRPISREVLDTAAEIIGRKLTKCEETDVINLVRIV